MPATDEGEVRVEVEMEVGTRLDLLDRQFCVIEAIVKQNVPEIRNVVTNVGGSRWYGGGGHTGDIRISLVPQSQRTRSSEQIADDLRQKLSGIPGVTVAHAGRPGLVHHADGHRRGQQGRRRDPRPRFRDRRCCWPSASRRS